MAHNARVIFRAHPFNYRYPDAEKMIADIGAVLDADRGEWPGAPLGPAAEQEMSVEDCFNASTRWSATCLPSCRTIYIQASLSRWCRWGVRLHQLVDAPAAEPRT